MAYFFYHHPDALYRRPDYLNATLEGGAGKPDGNAEE